MDRTSPAWPGILAALLIFSLLLAFHQVVRGAVEQGAVRLKATALYNVGALRCNSLRDSRANENCLSQLRAQDDDNALRQVRETAEEHAANDQVALTTTLDPLWNK
ncbi:MAG: hypothetical protein V4713_04595 [Pseudomonadota bacterium]